MIHSARDNIHTRNGVTDAIAHSFTMCEMRFLRNVSSKGSNTLCSTLS